MAAIGLGVPSTIDQASGTAVSSVNIPLTDVPLRTLIGERFGLPCGIDNDANAAAIGEWHAGAGKGTRDMIMLTLGTGVGGGLILDGRPYRGALGAAAELGHIVIEHDGRPCQGSCTGRGHLEAYATGLAATADARRCSARMPTRARCSIVRTTAATRRSTSSIAWAGGSAPRSARSSTSSTRR